MEGKGGLRAPFGLCRPRCSPLSAEATFPASPRSDLGEWGEPRRRHGPAPRGGFQQRAREARLGSESARGPGSTRGPRDSSAPRHPHTPLAAPAGERLRGRKEESSARQTPGAFAELAFISALAGERIARGRRAPLCPRLGTGGQRPLPAPPSAGCDRVVRKAAAARRGPARGPEPGGGQTPQRTSGRARGQPPCAGRERKAPVPRGNAALRRLRGKQDLAAVRCTGACPWQPPSSRCLQGRGYKLNIVCAAGTKYPGLTGMGGGGRDIVRPPVMNNPGRPPGCGGQIALESAKRSVATSARASGAVGLSPAGYGSTHTAVAERTALPPPGPPARGPGRSPGVSLGRRMGDGSTKRGSEVWKGVGVSTVWGCPAAGGGCAAVPRSPGRGALRGAVPRAARCGTC